MNLKYDLGMDCVEKQNLQQKCIAASHEFDAATEQLRAAGIALDLRSLKVEWKPSPTSVKKMREMSAILAVARSNHLQASSELSRHLSAHRC